MTILFITITKNESRKNEKTKWLVTVFLLLSVLLMAPWQISRANSKMCHGSFVNPITDVCWSCLFPITIGSMPVVHSDMSDTDNPRLPVCACMTPFPRIGISIGLWEPVALTDVTRHPYCMVNLGGFQMDSIPSLYLNGTVETANSNENHSFYHLHWYKYPVLFWLRVITDFLCLETGDLDIAYLTELDPSWGNDELGFVINPEAFLFGNLIAQAACSADALAASIKKPMDFLFWCAGAQGSFYPLNGHVQEHVSNVQATTLLTERMAYKLHRKGLLRDSVGEDGAALCDTHHITPIIPKSRYRYQMVNPVPTTGKGGCHPFGATTATWEAGHSYPYKGEDFGYLVWRKLNCCA